MVEWSFVIYGAPRTKKNSGRRRWSFRQRRTVNVPSAAFEQWASVALKSLPEIRAAARAAGIALPITCDVNCQAQIYREANVGDAVGFYQAIADWMEAVGIVENDRQIRQWDGTRLRKDAQRPRVEVTLTTIQERG